MVLEWLVRRSNPCKYPSYCFFLIRHRRQQRQHEQPRKCGRNWWKSHTEYKLSKDRQSLLLSSQGPANPRVCPFLFCNKSNFVTLSCHIIWAYWHNGDFNPNFALCFSGRVYITREQDKARTIHLGPWLVNSEFHRLCVWQGEPVAVSKMLAVPRCVSSTFTGAAGWNTTLTLGFFCNFLL